MQGTVQSNIKTYDMDWKHAGLKNYFFKVLKVTKIKETFKF
jgi:hypothetical protein